MSEIAEEFSRRTSPEYVKARTKEAAVKKTGEIRDRTVTSPTALGIIGGGIGALAGMLAGRRGRERWGYHGENFRREYRGDYRVEGYGPSGHYERTYYGEGEGIPGEAYYPPRSDYAYYPNQEGGGESRSEQMKERAGELKHRAQDKAEDLKHRVQDKAEDLKHRVSGASESVRERARYRRDEMRERTPQMRESISQFYNQKMNDQPLFIALGTLALGAAAALLLPVSRRERSAVAPLKERAREQIDTVGREVERRIEGGAENVEEEQFGGGRTSGIINPDEVAPGGPIIH